MARSLLLLATAVASAVAVESLAACAPPSIGQSVQSLVCTTAGANLRFNFTRTNVYSGQGQIFIPNTEFCLAVQGVIASDGAPAVQLGRCPMTAGTDPTMLFTPMVDGSIVSATNGQCLDLVSGVQAPNEVRR